MQSKFAWQMSCSELLRDECQTKFAIPIFFLQINLSTLIEGELYIINEAIINGAETVKSTHENGSYV